MHEIAELIVNRRVSLGLSQSKAARLMEVPQSTLSRGERGKVHPSPLSAIRLAQVLGGVWRDYVRTTPKTITVQVPIELLVKLQQIEPARQVALEHNTPQLEDIYQTFTRIALDIAEAILYPKEEDQ